MKAELKFTIEAPSLGAANALASRVRTRLSEETTVHSSSVEATAQDFDVLGVDIVAKERFIERVEAASATEAEATVATETKVVALVRARGGADT